MEKHQIRELLFLSMSKNQYSQQSFNSESNDHQHPATQMTQDQTAKTKKRFIFITIFMVVSFILVALSTFFAIRESIKLNNINKERKSLEQQIQSRNKKIQDLKINKILDLSDLGLKSIKLQVAGGQGGVKLKSLNLTSNGIQNLSDLNLYSVEKIYLKGNPLKSITNNNIQNIKSLFDDSDTSSIATQDRNLKTLLIEDDFQMDMRVQQLRPSDNISKFTGNQFQLLTVLNLSNCGLVEFENNVLPKIQKLYLDRNPKLQQSLVLDQLDELTTLKSITLSGSGLSAEGIAHIKSTHPGISIDV